ncbi:transmembrane emp24 domain-containing protein B-like isoform X1 [Tigriopus californicus]|uniref:transmembrane emp24 domain-containing protein B-like isoform X1 n=1 Tax=Tigriopus californicus TaxID=6832 RepID=UPI0027D9F2BE|nr:transmembrane emp24 domain-containing protein B-like isoform X1 [Tigriopus californicus]
MPSGRLRVLTVVLLVWGSSVYPRDVHGEEASVETVFDPNDDQQGYQRRYIIEVLSKKEECFFIENVQENQIFNFHFMVTNTDSSGNPLDISTKIRAGPKGKVVNFQSRRNEGKLIGHPIVESGDYEICFNNRFSMMESKRIFWQFEVEGQVDELKELHKAVDESLTEYQESAKMTKRKISLVRGKVSRIRHSQWRHESLMKKDMNRAEAMALMIGRWSIAQAIVVVFIGLGQVYFLRRLFNTKASPHRINARA